MDIRRASCDGLACGGVCVDDHEGIAPFDQERDYTLFDQERDHAALEVAKSFPSRARSVDGRDLGRAARQAACLCSEWPSLDAEPLVEKRPEVALKDGSRYTGQWLGVERHGQGVLVSPEGWRYEGSFEDSQAHGVGFLLAADGTSYSGQWRSGERHGFGYRTLPDGSAYEGEWRDHEMNGDGVQRYGAFKPLPSAEGVASPAGLYDGQFRNGQRGGRGTYSYADGRRYVGQFLQGVYHGCGTLSFADGTEFQGGFLRGKKHGMGSFRWPDGRRYVGLWQHGHTDGKGVIVEVDGVERQADHDSIQSALFLVDPDPGMVFSDQPHATKLGGITSL